jgi:hypothetical protein
VPLQLISQWIFLTAVNRTKDQKKGMLLGIKAHLKKAIYFGKNLKSIIECKLRSFQTLSRQPLTNHSNYALLGHNQIQISVLLCFYAESVMK